MAVALPDVSAVEVLPTPHQDANLLALCDRFMAAQAHVDFINHDLTWEPEYELAGLCASQAPLLDAMDECRATTLARHQARAQVLMGQMTWLGSGK